VIRKRGSLIYGMIKMGIPAVLLLGMPIAVPPVGSTNLFMVMNWIE
jgi:hypothetical protein